MNSGVSHPGTRESVAAAAQALLRSGVTSHSGHGNLSARADGTAMLLTSGGRLSDARAESLALVGLDRTVLEGALDPTNAEIVAMHSEVYRARADVGGVIHTHSPGLLAFAMAGRPLPCRYEALLRFGQATDVPVAPWAPRGSERSVGGIVDAMAEHPATSAVLLGNHGVLVFAADPGAAALLLIALEEAAEAELAAAALGGAADLPAGALADVRASMARTRA